MLQVQMEWDGVWKTLQGLLDRNEAEDAKRVWAEVVRAISDMSPEGFSEVMETCPEYMVSGSQSHPIKLDLWRSYVAARDFSMYSLKRIAKFCDDLSPAIAILVWAAWVNQVDVSAYPIEEVERIAKRAPTEVHNMLIGSWGGRPDRLVTPKHKTLKTLTLKT